MLRKIIQNHESTIFDRNAEIYALREEISKLKQSSAPSHEKDERDARSEIHEIQPLREIRFYDEPKIAFKQADFCDSGEVPMHAWEEEELDDRIAMINDPEVRLESGITDPLESIMEIDIENALKEEEEIKAGAQLLDCEPEITASEAYKLFKL